MKTKYLCGVDYQYELEAGCASLYDDLEEFKASRPCHKQCGIVEITFDENGKEVGHKWLEEQKLF